MGNSNLSGIEGFFNDLDMDEPSRSGETATVQEKPVGEKAASQKSKRKQKSQPKHSSGASARESRTEPVRVPTGRPPGKLDGNGPRRTKASLWLDADLLEEYRERVYVERRHLGELIERALREYKRGNW